MTPKEYLIAKNALVKRATGVVLIPEDQIIEHELSKRELYSMLPEKGLYSSSCTYCLKWAINFNLENKCINCIMYKKGNRCKIEGVNTWNEASGKWNEKATRDEKQELYDLTTKFIKTYRKEKGYE